jgi:hypothetical protein
VLDRYGAVFVEQHDHFYVVQLFELPEHLGFHVFVACGYDRHPRVCGVFSFSDGEAVYVVPSLRVQARDTVEHAEVV